MWCVFLLRLLFVFEVCEGSYKAAAVVGHQLYTLEVFGGIVDTVAVGTLHGYRGAASFKAEALHHEAVVAAAAHSKAVAEGSEVYQVAAVALAYRHGGGGGMERQHAGTAAAVSALHVGAQARADVVELYLRVAIVQYSYGTLLLPGLCGGLPEVVEVVRLR